MRLEWIEDLLAVLDTGSFRAAAEARFLTASAFTRRIRTIEDALGCPLFDRTKKPLVLLPHAEKLEVDLRNAAKELKRLRLHLSDAQETRRDRLSIGCQHSLTATTAPRIVQRLSQHHEVNVRVHSGTRSQCLMMLLRREIDFALVYGTSYERDPLGDVYVERLAIGDDRFVPLGNLTDHAALRREIDAGHLPMIQYPTSTFLGEVQREAIDPHVHPRFDRSVVAETSLTLAITEFLRRGIGIGWLPETVAAASIRRREIETLEDILPCCDLQISLLRLRSARTEWSDALWSGDLPLSA